MYNVPNYSSFQQKNLENIIFYHIILVFLMTHETKKQNIGNVLFLYMHNFDCNQVFYSFGTTHECKNWVQKRTSQVSRILSGQEKLRSLINQPSWKFSLHFLLILLYIYISAQRILEAVGLAWHCWLVQFSCKIGGCKYSEIYQSSVYL